MKVKIALLVIFSIVLVIIVYFVFKLKVIQNSVANNYILDNAKADENEINKANEENANDEIDVLDSKQVDGNEIIVINDNKKVLIDSEKEDIHIRLSSIGDIMCHNSQFKDAYETTTKTYDFSYVFTDVEEMRQNTDIFIGNLETTFAGAEKGYSNYPQFNSPEQLAYDLKELGLDIVTTSNNHCLDSGYFGIESTLNYLDDAKIKHTGTNRSEEEQNTILIEDVKGIRIAFLAFTYGTNGIAILKDKIYSVNLIDEEFIKKQLDLAKEENPDLICVSMHWGTEYEGKQNKTQERLADFLIGNGADIVLGSHPHVLQPMEFREVILENGETKKGFVIYSMGNFVSGQTNTGTRTSIFLNLDIVRNGKTLETYIEDISYFPIYTYTETAYKGYKILNIEKAIREYENEENKKLSENNYNLLKKEFDRVKELLTIN